MMLLSMIFLKKMRLRVVEYDIPLDFIMISIPLPSIVEIGAI